LEEVKLARRARLLLATRLKVAQLSGRPRRARRSGPVTFRAPPVPTSLARTIRGEKPVWVTTMFLSLPRTRPPSFAWIEAWENFLVQRC
jgi:hypothetical protein